ncbi:class I SAM-dependent methyltransferase [Agrobacterium sp. LMR679]|uniref:class I SAM-dependent methyltransferase n=1 Tax=Agrobacterium sp. LMR679 TaxID=3014335 RepID=UPI0022AF1B50|nr:class I SAM-dependent methyltransferase [Agrobacterium sp. LMR679]MCZ4073362.1 class I SAM-dependent methyltransferase [Agrobacterium sp. LMR679]
MNSILPQVSAENRLKWQGFENGVSPFLFQILDDNQKRLYMDWFKETADQNLVGETSQSVINALVGLIFGNKISRVVQCGHYAGYSLILLGMLAKSYASGLKIASIDIDQSVTTFTDKWVEKCGLTGTCRTWVRDSSDSFAAKEARDFLGDAPELVFIDSSHQYRHTIDELNLWASEVAPGGLICMHDAAPFAKYQDHSNLGGVNRALEEWCADNPSVEKIVLQSGLSVSPVFKDPCGLAIMQILHPADFSRTPARSDKRMVKDTSFAFSDQWVLGEGWSFAPGKVSKQPGTSSSLSCFSPVKAGEKYRVTAELIDVKAGGLHPGAGGSDLGAFFSSDGAHEAEIVAGNHNALIGLLASEDFDGTVVRMDAEYLGTE